MKIADFDFDGPALYRFSNFGSSIGKAQAACVGLSVSDRRRCFMKIANWTANVRERFGRDRNALARSARTSIGVRDFFFVSSVLFRDSQLLYFFELQFRSAIFLSTSSLRFHVGKLSILRSLPAESNVKRVELVETPDFSSSIIAITTSLLPENKTVSLKPLGYRAPKMSGALFFYSRDY